MHRTLHRFACLALSISATSVGAGAQSASIPPNVAEALFGSPWRGAKAVPMQITVGAPPAGFPAAWLPPAPASVVGGAVEGDARTIALAFPASDSQPTETYRAFLARSGWTKPKEGPPGEGFVVYGGPAYSAWLCRDSLRATVLPAPGAPAGMRYVRAEFYPARGGQRCDAAPRSRPFEYDIEFPQLLPPADAQPVGGTSGGGGGDKRSTATRLRTAMTIPQLLDHYSSQLRTAGWTIGRRLVADDAGFQLVEARDRNGKSWRGTLAALVLGDTRAVELQMARVDVR